MEVFHRAKDFVVQFSSISNILCVPRCRLENKVTQAVHPLFEGVFFDFLNVVLIFFDDEKKDGGIANEIPWPYQKKSLISIIPRIIVELKALPK